MFNFRPESFNEIISFQSIIVFMIITGTAFVCAYFVYPIIIYLSHVKRLSQAPNERSSHTMITPVLGGIGIFIGFIFSAAVGLFFLLPNLNLLVLVTIFLSSFALFVIGLKDDILPTKALKKLIAQIIVASFIVFITKNEINSLQGLFGIYELPELVSSIFTVFVFVVIINGLNLIDGIDGLAGLQSIVIMLMFGVYFALNNEFTLTLIACCLVGALIAFLFFNFSSQRKIFMGDCGSIFVGFIIAYFAVAALNVDTKMVCEYELKNSAVIVMSILSYPLLDTLRVFIIRIYAKSSPFSPDRNHMHHLLIDMGMKHRNASVGITLYTIILTSVAISLNFLEVNQHFFTMAFIVVVCISVVLIICRLKKCHAVKLLNDSSLPKKKD